MINIEVLKARAYEAAYSQLGRGTNHVDAKAVYEQLCANDKEVEKALAIIDNRRSAYGVEIDGHIQESISEAVTDFRKDQEEASLQSNEDPILEGLSPLEAIESLPLDCDYLPPVNVLVALSKLMPTDNERDFYNAIQRLREKGWTIESAGRGKGYNLARPAGLGDKVKSLSELVKHLSPDDIAELEQMARLKKTTTKED